MSTPRISLRKRLVLLVGGGFLALLLAQYVATELVLEERQEELIDAVLAEQMRYSMQLYRQTGQVPTPNVPHLNFHAWPLGQPGPEVPAFFHGFGPGSHEVYVDDREYHFVVHDEDGYRFLLAQDVEHLEAVFAELVTILGVAFLLSAGLALGGIYWLSGRALHNLTDLAAAVRNGNDTLLATPDMEAEVHALASALDDYHARQSLLLEREREFSGYLSHELRTPLSVVRGQAEMLMLENGGNDNLRQRADSIVAQVDRMRVLIEQLLHLARRTHVPQRQAVLLPALVNRLWDELAHDSDSHTRLHSTLDERAEVVADPLLLELILRNALANARLHADGAELRVSFREQTLVIEDFRTDGTPLPPLPDDEKNEGLGLTILKHACKLLGWSCEIAALPTGLRLSIRLPG